jgi:hypothetical protein
LRGGMQGFRLILAYFPASLTLFLWLYSFLYKGFSLFWQALNNSLIDYPVKRYDRAFELASDVINENFTART